MTFIVTERYFDNGRVSAYYEPYTGGDVRTFEARAKCDVYRCLASTEAEARRIVQSAKEA